MPTPEFVLALREKIGQESLWLSGITAVVDRVGTDGHPEVLLVKRSDTGHWTNVAGIIDPGEEPADAAEREILEEAGIVAIAERLVWVHVLPPIQWPNGDRAQFLDLVFRCRYVSGDPHPADGENTDARWFGIHELPDLPSGHAELIQIALAGNDTTRFERSSRPATDPIVAHYTERSASYDDSTMHRELADAVADQIDRPEVRRVIDLATGTGLVLRGLVRRRPDLDLVGVDLTTAMLDVARTHLPTATLVNADIARTPLPDEDADVVTCVTALHLVPDPAAVLAEAGRLVRPDGRVITATFADRTAPRTPRPMPTHHDRVDSVDKIAALAAPAGLVPVRHRQWTDGTDTLLIAELARRP